MGNNQIVLLKCTTSYSVIIEDSILCMIQNMAVKFNVIRGLSDHNLGYIVPIAVTILGTKIVIKHFIIDILIVGPILFLVIKLKIV